ncbi:unnamed protein product [Trifolium pratense]|uniref:Uncharacterized protein n=1 Tax=Trifolium pratense TaxID=57577 RepID=A0ACB0KZJ6_TRIPR|nr:unnamed protein product [Trifolium pratense]
MSFQIFPHDTTMNALGITASVKFLINQLGWDNLDLSSFPTYRNLTIEFLSSFVTYPHYGLSPDKGQTRFRLFGVDCHYSYRNMADLMKVPSSPDAATKVQEDAFMDYELSNLWGSISGEPNAEPADRVNQKIHNPAICYFHMLLAHTIFGKPENDTAVSKEELFILYCAFQGRPLIINRQPVHHFTLPNLEKTSIHDKNNWLFNLEGEDEHDPETPPFYYTPGPPSPTQPAESISPPTALVDHTAAIAELTDTVATLRSDLNKFLDLTIVSFDNCAKEFASIHNALKNLRDLLRKILQLNTFYGTVYGSVDFPKLTFSERVKLRAGVNKISLLSVAVGLPKH